jgi:hypothetical protein
VLLLSLNNKFGNDACSPVMCSATKSLMLCPWCVEDR